MQSCNIIDNGYIGDDEYYLVECQQCGNDFKTDNEKNLFCSKACYKAAKYEWENE